MATHVTHTPGQLIIQNENLDLHYKKATIDGKTKSSNTVLSKRGKRLGSRKALNDITNKSSLHHREVSSKKKNVPKEEFNISEEKFLHDHKKCIEAQKTVMNAFHLDMVLPGHDSFATAKSSESKQAKIDTESPSCYPEPVELSMSEFSEWLESSTQWDAPSGSPMRFDSPPSSPVWQFKDVEFVLKEYNDVLL